MTLHEPQTAAEIRAARADAWERAMERASLIVMPFPLSYGTGAPPPNPMEIMAHDIRQVLVEELRKTPNPYRSMP